MNGWIIGGVVAFVVFVVPVCILAYALCKVASDADDQMGEW